MTPCLLALVSAVLFGGVETSGCTKDTDCKGERVCDAGACVAPTGAPVEKQALSTPSELRGSAFVDPMGLLLFGPVAGVELGSGRFSGTVYGRLFGIGALSKSMFLGPGDYFSESFGLGVLGRHYFSDGLQGAHLGLQIEYLRSHFISDSLAWAITQQYFVPQLEVGYRFGIGIAYLGLKLSMGFAVQAAASVQDLTDGAMLPPTWAADASSAYGSMGLDVGIRFGG